MRKPECREGKENNQDMRKISRTAPTAISVQRKALAGGINAIIFFQTNRKRKRKKPVQTVLTGCIFPVSATVC
jgi:hypothetical protein